MKPATAKPFLFEQSFDEEAMQRARERKRREAAEAKLAAEQAELDKTPPPPTFSEEELQAAQAAAWQEGHQTGLADAQKQNEAHVLALLENLGAQISGMHVHQDLANERIAAELTGFALEICRRILPTFIDSHGGDEVRALLGECLEKITPASRILITVSPDTATLLEPQMDALAARSGFEGRMKLIADPTIGSSDIVAAWDGGNLERLEKDLWRSIEAVVDRTRAAAPPAPDLPQPPEQPPKQTVEQTSHEDQPAMQEAPSSDLPELIDEMPASDPVAQDTAALAEDTTETAVSEEDRNV